MRRIGCDSPFSPTIMRPCLRMTWILLLSCLLLCRVNVASGQFGVARSSQQEVVVETDGAHQALEDEHQDEIYNNNVSFELVQKLMNSHQDMHQTTAVDIAAIIESAKNDPETVLLLRRIKEGSGADHMKGFQDTMSVEQISAGLAQTMQELQMLDILFRDPRRAVQEMDKEGMIAKEKLAAYRKDPKLLEEDTRKALYFTFISLATTGGFM
jgi:hypothetical protein